MAATHSLQHNHMSPHDDVLFGGPSNVRVAGANVADNLFPPSNEPKEKEDQDTYYYGEGTDFYFFDNDSFVGPNPFVVTGTLNEAFDLIRHGRKVMEKKTASERECESHSWFCPCRQSSQDDSPLCRHLSEMPCETPAIMDDLDGLQYLHDQVEKEEVLIPSKNDLSPHATRNLWECLFPGWANSSGRLASGGT